MAGVQRNKLRNRAERQAARKYAAQNARLDAQQKAAQKTYSQGVGAAKGAAAMSRASIRAALASLEDSGLHGLALQQARDELLGQIQGTHGMVKWQKAELRSDLQDDLAQIDDARFNLSVSEANAADSLFRAKVTKHKAMVKKQRQRERGRAQDHKEHVRDFNAEVRKAMAEIRNTMAEDLGTGPLAVAQTVSNLSDPKIRRASVDHLVAAQGYGRKAAQEAIRRFLKAHASPIPMIPRGY